MSRFQKLRVLISDSGWRRWLTLIVLTVLSSLFEAVGATLILTLLRSFTEPTGSVADLPGIALLEKFVELPNKAVALRYLLGITSAFFVLRACISIVQSYVQSKVVQEAGLRLSSRLFTSYLRLPYVFHIQRHSAETVRNIYHSVGEIVSHVLTPAVRLVTEGLLAIALCAVVIAASPIVALSAGVILAVFVASVTRIFRPKLVELGHESQVWARGSLHLLNESLQAFREIKTTTGSNHHISSRFTDVQHNLVRTRYLRQFLADFPRYTVETFAVLLILGGLAVSTFRESSVQEALPLVGLFAYATLRLLPSINRIVSSISNLHYGAAAIDDLYADLIFLETNAATRPVSAPQAVEFTQGIRVKGLTFVYPQAKSPALRDIDLEIARGDVVGIAGESGSGKSTLLDVLIGLLPPTKGSIAVDSMDIGGDLSSWMSIIGVVSQNAVLLDDSLRNNVLFGTPEDELRLSQCLEVCMLGNVVQNLPEGTATSLGERGLRLSGGERQRLALARALYKSPQVLFLDEATSALDPGTESAVLQNLRGIAGLTIVMVAHRVQTLQVTDYVVVIKNGRVEAIDSFKALADGSQAFQSLLAHTATDEEAD